MKSQNFIVVDKTKMLPSLSFDSRFIYIFLLFQVYGPCVLLVVISWVSFWLNREATSDRISLGKTVLQNRFNICGSEYDRFVIQK